MRKTKQTAPLGATKFTKEDNIYFVFIFKKYSLILLTPFFCENGLKYKNFYR